MEKVLSDAKLIEFTEKHAKLVHFSMKKVLFGIVESDGSKNRFRFPNLESSTQFPDSILDALQEMFSFLNAISRSFLHKSSYQANKLLLLLSTLKISTFLMSPS